MRALREWQLYLGVNQNFGLEASFWTSTTPSQHFRSTLGLYYSLGHATLVVVNIGGVRMEPRLKKEF